MANIARIGQITTDDGEWLRAHQPYLTVIKKDQFPTILKGLLVFDAVWISKEEDFIVNPEPADQARGEFITDSYKVSIKLAPTIGSALPTVKEVGGRIIPKDSRHIDSQSIGCLCSSLLEDKDLPDGYSIPDFFIRLVVPYFFAQTYYERHSRWPWPDLSHGSVGICEAYLASSMDATKTALAVKELANQPNWHKSKTLLIARHGDDVPWKQRSPRGFKGLLLLRQNVRKYKIALPS